MEWINAKVSLPDDCGDEASNEYYLVYCPEYGFKMAMYMNGSWWVSYLARIEREVSHWLPIEKPTN